MKRMNRKPIALATAILLLGVSMAGCSSKSDDTTASAGRSGAQGGAAAAGKQAETGSQGLKAPPAPP